MERSDKTARQMFAELRADPRRRPFGFGRKPMLVNVDWQNAYTAVGEFATAYDNDPRAFDYVNELADLARARGLPVMWTYVAYRPDGVDCGVFGCRDNGPDALQNVKRGARRAGLDARLRIDPERDYIVNKLMPSAFHETNLSSLLVYLGCDTVIVTGGSTSGCVRATVVDSLSRGYRTIVPEECVADLHESPHFANLYDMHKKYADVLPVAEVLDYYRARPPAEAFSPDGTGHTMRVKLQLSSGPPLYARVYQSLRDEILSNRYPVGGALPSEYMLEQRFLVSRITVRRALEELERAGLIERSQGRSATILPRPAPPIIDVGQEMASALAEAADMRPRILSFRWIRPEADLAETLQVAPDSRVLWVTRLRCRLGQPVGHTSVHMPEEIGREMSEEVLERLPLIEVLRTGGHVAHSAEQLLSAAPAPPVIAKLLDLAPGAPVFSLRRLMRDAEGRPILLLHASMRWDRFSYPLSLRQTKVAAPSDGAASAPMAEDDRIEELDFAL